MGALNLSHIACIKQTKNSQINHIFTHICAATECVIQCCKLNDDAAARCNKNIKKNTIVAYEDEKSRGCYQDEIRRLSNQTKSYIIQLTTHSKKKQKNKTQSTCKCIYYYSTWHYSAVLWLGFATPECMQSLLLNDHVWLAGQQSVWQHYSLLPVPFIGTPRKFQQLGTGAGRHVRHIAYLQASIEHTTQR